MNDGGKIVTIVTSLLGAFTGFYSTYAGSKAPVDHFTRAAAKEFGPREGTGFEESKWPGVFELDTSNVLTGATYPMNVSAKSAWIRCKPSSDLELKLVVIRLVGTGRRRRTWPLSVNSRRKIGEIMPKLESTVALLNTSG